MSLPKTCALWTNPEPVLATPMKEQFELIETLFHSSHHWRYVLRCRNCGADYLFEFYEEIDWETGKDAQRSTFVPIQSDAQMQRLRADRSPTALMNTFPRLVEDKPRGTNRTTLDWIGREDLDTAR